MAAIDLRLANHCPRMRGSSYWASVRSRQMARVHQRYLKASAFSSSRIQGNRKPRTLDEGDIIIPDLITDLQDRTQLTRRSIVRILTESGRLADFKRNPQAFIDMAGDAINRAKRQALVDGIKYQKLGDTEVYAQELFETEELVGYLKNMLQDTE
jgi:restriction endonuclease